ncbi:LamG-like jellyroll fold domain-containing protein [uncultured Polaribacter sp.]|uniref:LamG-like jellyroll fold domain-containing protein n=1 Tax=uncultured Polaribacter sp. TaxID=174711 RepID=UPI00262BDD77|nr:LamG-like jellyroll fold domain-containing protein [uncultured Polaribacter sp.]
MMKKILLTFLIAFGFHTMHAQSIDRSKILMHFPFDDDLTDATGVVTLTPKTAALVDTYDTGKFGKAALFNSKPYITSGSLFDAGESFTIAMWVKFNSLTSTTGSPKLIHQENTTGASILGGRPLQIAAGNVINCGFGEAAGVNSSAQAINTWVHVAAVMNKTSTGGTIKLYINGVQVISKSVGAGIVQNKSNNAELSIGVQKASQTAGLLDGYMDDFLITKEVLTPDQIIAIRDNGVSAETALVWNGTASNDWSAPANWAHTQVPTINDNVLIPSGTSNQPTASSAISVNNMVLEKNTSLTSTGAITATSTKVYAGSSVIAPSVSGSFTYKVITEVGNTVPAFIPNPSGSGTISNPAIWTLMSSPVVGETYDNQYILDNFIGTGSGANRAIALYDNTSSVNGGWAYFQASTTAETFNQAIGFSTRKKGTDYQNNDEEIYIFEGTYPDADVTVSITQGSVNNWNLVGNPFPSYIKVSDLISANTTNLGAAFQTVYVWKPLEGSYEALEASTDYIAPGQGFFVSAANSTADNFVIATSIQSHQTSTPFFRSNNSTIKLNITDGSISKTTFINYSNSETTDLDSGKDIGLFTGVPSDFNIYTHLVSNDNGIAFEKQALPETNLEEMVIPVGVVANAGKQISFSAENQNLPNGINVYLEDRLNNVFTKLDLNSNYTLTLDTQQEGIGRFYLHTLPSAALNTENISFNSVRIFKTSNNNLRISGLTEGESSFKIFTILGKQVVNTSFNSKGSQNISLPNLATGVYIIKLQTKLGSLSKKIILE